MRLLATFATAGLLGITAAAQAPAPAQTPIPPRAGKHIETARTAAGTDHAGVWKAVCDTAVALANPPAPRGGGAGRGGGQRGGGPPAAPARERWYAEPQKVFDNLYFVGEQEYSAWAITTSQGIILLDAIFDYSVEAEVDEGLRRLGLNPADIKYVVISHGHLDHAGGAKFLQEKYGARLLMSAADYDLLDQQNPSWKPKRDIVVTDGYRLTLGDTTMTLYLTPGHTEGTISTVFPVRDGGRQHLAATWGGTLFNFGRNLPRLKAYAASAERFRDIVAKANADVILSNHTVYDGSKTKLPAVKARSAGQPHPYVVGNRVVQSYLTTVGECAQAAIAIVEAP
jgi:metallo-beta-lactamase class B